MTGNVLAGNLYVLEGDGNCSSCGGRRDFNARLGGISSVVEAGNILMSGVGSRKCPAPTGNFLVGDRKCSGRAGPEMFWGTGNVLVGDRKCSGGCRQFFGEQEIT